jgi:hypothetical protein
LRHRPYWPRASFWRRGRITCTLASPDTTAASRKPGDNRSAARGARPASRSRPATRRARGAPSA